MLFNSQRSASIVAATDISLWALNGKLFSKVLLDPAQVIFNDSMHWGRLNTISAPEGL